MIDIRKLRYFATVAELGSFTRAASQLGVAQPALTRQVQLLEQDLGQQLLLRTRRKISLTDAGAALLRHANAINRDFERLMDDMRARSGTPTGNVVIGIPPTLSETLVPPLAERVRRAYPRITLRIAEAVTPVLADWVQNNVVDFAIISLSVVRDIELEVGLRLQTLAEEDMIVVEKWGDARPPRTYSLARLRSKPLVLSDLLATIVRRQLAMSDLAFNVTIEIDAVQAIKSLVMRGEAASILPVSMLSGELRRGSVAGSAITAQGVRRRLALAQPHYRQMTQAGEAVHRAIREEIEALDAEGLFSLKKLERKAVAPASAPMKGAIAAVE